MDLIEQWKIDAVCRPAVSILHEAVVTGERIAHLGPRNDFARITLRFEPADEFSVSMNRIVASKEIFQFAKAAIFGVLDILTTYASYPVLKVRVIVEHIDTGEIDSSELAFRLAGRDATRKALDQVMPS